MAISPEHVITTPERVLALSPMEGFNAKNSMGIVDPRLFKDGEDGNRLRAIMDMETCLWTLKYDKGAIPPVLQGQRFTSFKNAKKFAEDYFAKRNITVTEVN